MFGGIPVKRKPEVKLVGFLFDDRMTWFGMVAANAKKARWRLGMQAPFGRLQHGDNVLHLHPAYYRIWLGPIRSNARGQQLHMYTWRS